jgi:hypothetical protein
MRPCCASLAERTHADVDVRDRQGRGRSKLIWENIRAAAASSRHHSRWQARFIGSQSLRRSELDKRREIGLFINDGRVVKELRDVFEQDWALTDSGRRAAKAGEQSEQLTSGAPAYAAAAGR